MAYEPRTFQAVTANTPPTGTDPMVDNTANGDVQAIKIIDATAGSTTPLAGQKARAISLSVTLSTEDVAALTPPGAISGFATAANQSTIIGHLDGVEAALALLLAEATFTGRVGEVQASPTANTVLARLKTIGDALAAALTVSGTVEVTNDVGNPLPVNGTVTANLGTIGSAATAANQSTANTALAAIQTAVEILDNIVAGSEAQVDVVGALPAGTNNIGDVDVLTLPADPLGANADAVVAAGAAGSISAKLRAISRDIVANIVLAAGTNNIGDVDVLTLPALPAGTNNIGDVDVLSLPALPAGTNNIGDVDAIQSGTWTVQPGNTANTTPWLVKEGRAATPSQSSVNDAATNTTLLASNANRLGATIYNDSTTTLYLKLGATASTTSYTAQLLPNSYYEVPYGYTGIIDGIWSADASGAARITELSA